MDTIFLRTPLNPEEVIELVTTLPQFKILSSDTLTKEEWAEVEILYGDHLRGDELILAPNLRWIHLTTQHLTHFCLKQIVHRENIIMTMGEEENVAQIAEFVLSVVFAFSKNLFSWKSYPEDIAKYAQEMTLLQGKNFLQIGLGKTGTEITKLAKCIPLNVIGISEKKSFHPFCSETFNYDKILEILPKADIVCIAPSLTELKKDFFTKNELAVVKDDAILIIIGVHALNLDDLVLELAKGKFKGVVIDGYIPYSTATSLLAYPQVLLTKNISSYPKMKSYQAFRDFKFNLRQYLHGNFKDMKNKVMFD